MKEAVTVSGKGHLILGEAHPHLHLFLALPAALASLASLSLATGHTAAAAHVHRHLSALHATALSAALSAANGFASLPTLPLALLAGLACVMSVGT